MNFPGSNNQIIGGMLPAFFHWGAREWPITFLMITNGMPICEMMAYPESYFTGYSLREQSAFKETAVEDDKGKRYEYQFYGFVKDRYALKEVLSYMMSQRHFVVCSDQQNIPRLLGRPGNMAQFVWAYDTGSEGSSDALIRWQFSWISKQPAPYVPFDLCGVVPETVDPSPLEGYVEGGYWLPEYTE